MAKLINILNVQTRGKNISRAQCAVRIYKNCTRQELKRVKINITTFEIYEEKLREGEPEQIKKFSHGSTRDVFHAIL